MMTKKIKARIDIYTTEEGAKGRYVDIGAILENSKGEFVLLDPTVNLAAIWARQAHYFPDKVGENVMCSVFEE